MSNDHREPDPDLRTPGTKSQPEWSGLEMEEELVRTWLFLSWAHTFS